MPGSAISGSPEIDLSARRRLPPWSAALPLRRWQRRALAAYHDCSATDFLLVATPAAGKTRGSLRIAHDLLARRTVERIVVVCPTEHLRRQWADAAHRAGLSLDPRFSNANGAEVTLDYHGIVTTYQQVSYAPSLYRKQCADARTLVIFDEVHHAGDQLTWGNALQEAFTPAARRLSLSGTPFRTDNYPIPFVTYKDERSRSDFSYSYMDGLRDGVCRPIYFPTVEGRCAG